MSGQADAEVQRLRLVRQLVDDDILHDPALIAAFRATPRELFVPYYFVASNDRPGWRLVEGTDEWQDGVYQNSPHITQIGNSSAALLAARSGEPVTGQPTSSSSAPSLMALMLEGLGGQDRNRVLEVGTGSGYNAALLCLRWGADHVTSVDVDPTLIDLARDRLAELGHEPHLVALDGRDGCPEQAPFDRIIATVGVDRIPAAWIEQTMPGGIILAPLMTGGLLARLTVDGAGRAEGSFLSDAGLFMPTRDRQTTFSIPHRDAAKVEPRTVHMSADIATDPDFEFFAALHTGPYSRIGFTPSNGQPPETWILAPDGSWACHLTTEPGERIVREGGRRRLWDEIEQVHRTWEQLDRPPRERFGLTVSGAEHQVWLDEPSTVIATL